MVDIWYEDLASDTSATVTRLCQFIGVDVGDTEIQPALRKVGARDLRESVANFDELLDNDSTRQLALAD